MDQYLPVDDRAETTLELILQPYIDHLYDSDNVKDLITGIITYLPSGLAYETELRFRMKRGLTDIDDMKLLLDDIGTYIILSRVCKNLPYLLDNKGVKKYYYMRENIISWNNEHEYFTPPPSEVITINIGSDSSELELNQDQMVGIAYAVHNTNNQIKLYSSVTNKEVQVDNIVKHSLIYRLPIDLATEQLKRPYRIDIGDNTINFTTPYFLQGVLSVASWLGLPNNGKNIIWKNLFQFTREGLIPLTF